MEKIKSVQKGVGEGSIFFTTDKNMGYPSEQVSEITEETRQVSYKRRINVLRGLKAGRLVFEMGVSNDVVIIYE